MRQLTRRAVVAALAGAASAASAGALAGCGSGQGQTGQTGQSSQPAAPAKSLAGTALEYWFSVGQEREPMMLEMLRAFEGATQAKVSWSHAPGDTQHLERLITASASGTPPDAAMLNAPFVPRLADNALMDVAPLAAKDKSFQMSEVFEPSGLDMLRQWSMSTSKIYSLPMGNVVLNVFYNRDKFAEAGLKDPNELYDKGQWTWAEIVASAVKLSTRRGDGTDTYGYAADLDVQRAVAFVPQNGGKLFDPATKKFVFANDAAAIDAIQWLVDLKEKHRVTQPTPVPQGEGAPMALFRAGRAAMYHGVATHVATIAADGPNGVKFGVAPLPVGKQEATFGNANFQSMLRASKVPDASWALLKHTVSAESYAIYTRHKLVMLPVLKDKRAKDAFTQGAVYGADRLVKHSLKALPENFVIPNHNDLRNAFNTPAKQIWESAVAVRTGLITAQQAMQQLYDTAMAGRPAS